MQNPNQGVSSQVPMQNPNRGGPPQGYTQGMRRNIQQPKPPPIIRQQPISNVQNAKTNMDRPKTPPLPLTELPDDMFNNKPIVEVYENTAQSKTQTDSDSDLDGEIEEELEELEEVNNSSVDLKKQPIAKKK